MVEVKGRLDSEAFRHFAGLLDACQNYASFSGCRFRRGSFDSLPLAEEADSPALSRSCSNRARFDAKIHAAPTVVDFTERLCAGEPALLEELDRAFRIIMVESVRNAMLGMFQALDMFPPNPAPEGIDTEDCSYEDVSAPLPVIAQRLYNDQERRVCDTSGGPAKLQRRAMTAAFIVDFAEAIDVALPAVPETQRCMLQDLTARIAEERGGGTEESSRLQEVFLKGLGRGAAAEALRQDVHRWWEENWREVAISAAVITTTGIFGVAAVAGYHYYKRRFASKQ